MGRSIDSPATRVSVALAAYYHRNGYTRRQSVERVERDGPRKYRKGDEIRFTAKSHRELADLQRLLRRAGIKPGRPFSKGRQYRLPVYGRKTVALLLKLMGERATG